MIPILIAVLGAILTIAGAIYQYIEKENSRKSADDAKKEAAKFNEKLIFTQNQLIIEQQKSVIANEKVIGLQSNIIGYTTGGINNKPFLEFDYAYIKSEDKFAILICVDNFGEFPLRDVTFSFDKEKYTKIANEIFPQKTSSNSNSLNLGKLDETLFFGTVEKGKRNIYAWYYINELNLEKHVSFWVTGEVRWNNGNYFFESMITLNSDKKNMESQILTINDSDLTDKQLYTFFPTLPKSKLEKRKKIEIWEELNY